MYFYKPRRIKPSLKNNKKKTIYKQVNKIPNPTWKLILEI